MTWNSIGLAIGSIFLAVAGFFGAVKETPLGATVYQIWQGGTGLSSVANNKILIGTGTQSLSAVASDSLPYLKTIGGTLTGHLIGTTASLGNIELTGYASASSFIGPLTGNATTATALAADPSDCSANQYANAISANGNLSCAQVAYSQISGTPTLGDFYTGLLMGEGTTTKTHITSLTYDDGMFNLSPVASSATLRLDWTNGPASRSAANTWSALNVFSAGVSVSGSFELTGGASLSGQFVNSNTASSSFAGSLNISKGLTANSYQGGGLTTCSAVTKVLRYNNGQYSCGTLTTSDIDYSAVFQPLDSDLTALAGTATTGLYTVTGVGTSATRTLTGGTAIQVANGSGVAGNPTLTLDATLQALAGTGGSSGMFAVIGSNSFTVRTIAGTANQIDVANGAGTLGNPTLTVSSTLVLPGTASASNTFEIAKSGNVYSDAVNALKLSNGANTRGLMLGYDDTYTAGYVRASRYGVGGNALLLNPNGAQSAAGGNVAVGASAPEQKFEVSGNVFASSSGNVDLILRSSTTSGTANNDDSKFIIRTGSASEDLLVKNGANQDLVRIASTGKFLITRGDFNTGVSVSYTGNSRFIIQNTQSCTTCLSSFAVIANSTTGANQQFFSTGYTTSGSAIADSYRILSTGTNGMTFLATDATGGVIRFYSGSGSTERARFDVGGRLGIGTTAPLQELHIASASEGNLLRLQDSTNTCDLDPDATLTTTCTSDARLKKNIKDYTGALSYLNGFRIRDYNMVNGGEHQIGVIAQELLKTHPEMVHMGDDGYYKVEEVPSWVLVKGIQELDTRVSALENGTPASFSLQSQLDQLSFWQLLKLLVLKLIN